MNDHDRRDPITWPAVAMLAVLCTTSIILVWLALR